jgi:hypothetical protein
MKFSEFLKEAPVEIPPSLTGNYILSHSDLTEVPKIPKKVYGYVDLTNNKLTSLKGSPEEVENYFTCDSNFLTSLEGGPKTCGAFFSCKENRLETLKGAPLEIDGVFDADDNELTSLEYVTPVSRSVYASRNKLTSLKDVHKHIKHTKQLFVDGNDIKSHVLGVLLIPGIIHLEIDHKVVSRIVNSFLPNGRGNDAVYECQEALLDEGLDEYAQL